MKKNIFLLDTDPRSGSAAIAILENLGYGVELSRDGNFDINNPGDPSPDLIIVDTAVLKPGTFTLPQRLRQARLDIPVVVSGEQDADWITTAFRKGASDYFAKPWGTDAIRNRLEKLFGRIDTDLLARSDSDVQRDMVQLERDRKELTDLLKISGSFSISANSKDILSRLTELAATSMRCESASIMMLNERKKCLEFVVATGDRKNRLETIEVPVGQGIAGWVAMHGESQIVNDTARDSRFTGDVDKQSGYSTRQILALPLRIENRITGVLEVINTLDNRLFDEDDLRILTGLGERVATVIETTRTIENHQNFFIQTTNLLVKSIERKDVYSEGHAWKVAELCHKIGSAMNLSESEKNDLHFGALLHDIGKLEMPSSLFNKRTLSERELVYIRQHPIKGAKLIEPITIWKPVVPLVLCHHEAWDGSGYPFGRSGTEIPLGSRIINLAESFSVMRATNSYRKQVSLKEAILEVMRMSGRQFDPDVVKVFVSVLENEISR